MDVKNKAERDAWRNLPEHGWPMNQPSTTACFDYIDTLEAERDGWRLRAEDMRVERDALRARVEELERNIASGVAALDAIVKGVKS
jgi:hypothetical protein